MKPLPFIRIAGRTKSSFLVLGWIGFFAGLFLAEGLMVALAWRWRKKKEWLQYHRPEHLGEIAQLAQQSILGNPVLTIFHRAASQAFTVKTGCTSLGIKLSGDRIKDAGGVIYHYTISGEGNALPEPLARSLGKALAHMRHPGKPTLEFLTTPSGAYHLLVHPKAIPQATG